MVFDAEPVEDGAWAIVDEMAWPKSQADGPYYKTHFATCANPTRFRHV